MSDLVEVVRCENCEFAIPSGSVYLCSADTNPNYYTADYFCAAGKLKKEMDEENKKAMAFADALYEEERLFFDTENYRVTGIYYTDRGDGTGYFVEENFSYSVILDALSYETEDEFMTYIYDHRERDKCYDSGTECFMWFYYNWVDRTDYVEFSKENIIDGAMSSYYGDNVLRNIKEWAEKAKGYDASEVFAKRGIY